MKEVEILLKLFVVLTVQYCNHSRHQSSLCTFRF